MALSFAAVFLYAGTMSTSGIVAAQDGRWFVFLLLPSFLVYLTSMVGETNRAPFDLPEARQADGGFHTEYSSLKFAMLSVRRIREHDDRVGAGHHDVPRRLGRAAADQHVGRRQFRLVAAAVVHRQGVGVPVLLLLAACHLAATALRPVHGAGLEGSHPGLAGMDRHCGQHAACAPRATPYGPTASLPWAPFSRSPLPHCCGARWGQDHRKIPVQVADAGGFPIPPLPQAAPRTRGAETPRRKPMPKFLDALAGFGVTFGTMFKKPITEEYPEARPRREALSAAIS